MSLPGDALDQVQEPAELGTGAVDGKEDHVEALLLGIGGGLDGEIDGPVHSPAICVLDEVFAGGDLDHDPFGAAIDRRVHIRLHAAGEGEYLRPEVALRDFSDGSLFVFGNQRHSRLDAVDAYLGQFFGYANLLVLAKHEPRLLLAVPQGYVVDLDLVGEREFRPHFIFVIEIAHEPLVGLPWRWLSHRSLNPPFGWWCVSDHRRKGRSSLRCLKPPDAGYWLRLVRCSPMRRCGRSVRHEAWLDCAVTDELPMS